MTLFLVRRAAKTETQYKLSWFSIKEEVSW
jgi:hypothetical protein